MTHDATRTYTAGDDWDPAAGSACFAHYTDDSGASDLGGSAGGWFNRVVPDSTDITFTWVRPKLRTRGPNQ